MQRWTRIRLATLLVIAPLAGCGQDPSDPVGKGESNDAVSLPSLPVAEPPLSRGELLIATARIRSAVALGQDDSAAQQGLDGKRFEARIRFGCPAAVRSAAADGKAPFEVRFDPEDRMLRLSAAPDLTAADQLVAPSVGSDIEAVEGFWMYRPWLLADGCPSDPPMPSSGKGASESGASGSAPIASDRIGIARFFATSDSRTRRRDERAYQATKQLAEGQQPSAQGYNLVLSGRLQRLPSGKVVQCRPIARDAPPECVISAKFDRVRIETADSGELLAEWEG